MKLNRHWVLYAIIGGILFILVWLGGAYEQRILENYRKSLVVLQDIEPDDTKRYNALKKLAKEVGASTIHTKYAGTTTTNGTMTQRFQDPIKVFNRAHVRK